MLRVREGDVLFSMMEDVSCCDGGGLAEKGLGREGREIEENRAPAPPPHHGLSRNVPLRYPCSLLSRSKANTVDAGDLAN